MRSNRKWASAFIIARAQVELYRRGRTIIDIGSPLLDRPAAKKMILPAHFILMNKRQILSVVALQKCRCAQKSLRFQQRLTVLEPSRNAPRNILEYLSSLSFANQKYGLQKNQPVNPVFGLSDFVESSHVTPCVGHGLLRFSQKSTNGSD